MTPQSPAPLLALSVTDEMVSRARNAMFGDSDYMPGSGGYVGSSAIRAALESVIADGDATYWKEMHRSLLTAYNELLAAKGGGVDAIRTAVADYMRSEGCSCCENTHAHAEHKETLAKLLDVKPYDDNSGYDFAQYRTGSEARS